MKGVRMIWIVNSIEDLENDIKGQFAYSVHFKPFGNRQRVRLWESILKRNKMDDLFGPGEVDDLAKKYAVNAGVIDSAIQKTLETYMPVERDRCKPSIIRSLEAHLTLAHNGKRIGMKDKIEDQYSLDSLNIQGNLTDMMAQLAKFDRFLRQRDISRPMNMNLLFYGSPGTGKSELAKYIAVQLDCRLLCKRASDIIDCWVGSTERNISAMFQEAEAEDAVLVIDEIDTFIFSRHNSIRSYETRATNEFLTQMENFNGILIGTTNNLTALDGASLRRFTYKIEFRYLTLEGCMFFYEKFLSPLTDEMAPETIKRTFARMNNLTPGDFKVVRDKHSFLERESVTNKILMEALEAESMTKPNHRNIGF
jgi:transitional endoplasmic reticulum ATPase